MPVTVNEKETATNTINPNGLNTYSLLKISELYELPDNQLVSLDSEQNPVAVKKIEEVPYTGTSYDVDAPNDLVLVKQHNETTRKPQVTQDHTKLFCEQKPIKYLEYDYSDATFKLTLADGSQLLVSPEHKVYGAMVDRKKNLLIGFIMVNQSVKDDGILFNTEKQNKASDLDSLVITHISPEIFEVVNRNPIKSSDLVYLLLNTPEQGGIRPLVSFQGSGEFIGRDNLHKSSHQLLNSSKVMVFLLPDLSSFNTTSVDLTTSLANDSLTSRLSSAGISDICAASLANSSFSISSNLSENAFSATEGQLTHSNLSILPSNSFEILIFNSPISHTKNNKDSEHLNTYSLLKIPEPYERSDKQLVSLDSELNSVPIEKIQQVNYTRKSCGSISDQSSIISNPSSSTTNNFPLNSLTSCKSKDKAFTSFSGIGGWILNTMIPETSLGGYKRLFKKSESLVISTDLFSLDKDIISVFLTPFGPYSAGTPSCSKNVFTDFGTFSSSRNFKPDIVFSPNNFSSISQGVANHPPIQAGILIQNPFDLHTRSKQLNNIANQYPGSFKDRLSMTNLGVGNDISHNLNMEQNYLNTYSLLKISDLYELPDKQLVFLDSEQNPVAVTKIERGPYTGKIYAVTVQNRILLVRRKNSTPVWCGNSNYDLQFLDLKCGNRTLDYQWLNNSVFIQDYSCTETGYETSKVLTSGKHTLQFKFGSDIAYAYNAAGEQVNASYWNSTKKIVIHHEKVNGTLTNFPVLVKVTNADLKTTANSGHV